MREREREMEKKKNRELVEKKILNYIHP